MAGLKIANHSFSKLTQCYLDILPLRSPPLAIPANVGANLEKLAFMINKTFVSSVFLSMSILVINGQNVDVKSIIKGNWCTCHSDGRYSEFYISDTIYEFTVDDNPPWPLIYHIRNDSLILHQFYDSSLFGIWTIQIINNNELFMFSEIDSITKLSYQNKLTRIIKNIKYHYKKRWKAKNCKDIRTDEEKEIEKQKDPQICIESDYFNKPKRTRKTN